MPQEFDDALIGAKPGDDGRGRVRRSPRPRANPEFVGKTAGVRHHGARDQGEAAAGARRRVRRRTPAGSTRWRSCATDIRARLDADKRELGRTRASSSARRAMALAEHLEGDAPEPMVDRPPGQHGPRLLRQPAAAGYITARITWTPTGVDPEQIRRTSRDEARVARARGARARGARSARRAWRSPTRTSTRSSRTWPAVAGKTRRGAARAAGRKPACCRSSRSRSCTARRPLAAWTTSRSSRRSRTPPGKATKRGEEAGREGRRQEAAQERDEKKEE